MAAPRKAKVAVAAVIGVILAVLIAYALVMYASVNRASEYCAQASASFESAKSSIDEADFAAAYTSARSALDSLSSLSAELSGAQWNIAAALPVVGEDVKIMQELSASAGLLANEAILPFLDQIEQFLDKQFLIDAAIAAIGPDNKLEARISAFKDTLRHATDVVYECETRLNALPKSHFAELNETADEFREAINTSASLLRFGEDTIDGLKQLGVL